MYVMCAGGSGIIHTVINHYNLHQHEVVKKHEASTVVT
jgi:hypothetical protein